MGRRWTRDPVALSPVLAGFVLAVVDGAATLAGLVTPLGAAVLGYPALLASSRRASPR